jgi:DNA-binding response OmpR family regulator
VPESSLSLIEQHIVPQPSRPPTILLVDDDRGHLETFARLLRFEGYRVRTAIDADSAIREAELRQPDAIILDTQTPLPESLGFLRGVRARGGRHTTPMAIVSGSGALDNNVLAEIKALGAELHFKPLWLQDLAALAVRLVGPPPPRNPKQTDCNELLLDGLPV